MNLFIIAHPNLKNSNINKTIKKHLIKNKLIYNADILDLHETYPNFDIDFNKEKDRVLRADIIIFVFPIYWYSITPILKQYIDIVFKKGFAYGEKFELKGKKWIAWTSSGKTKEGYKNLDHSLENLLKHFELSMNLIKMENIGFINNYGANVENIKDNISTIEKIIK